MFQIEISHEQIANALRQRLSDVEYELVIERIRSRTLEEAMMRLHQGETLHTGYAEGMTDPSTMDIGPSMVDDSHHDEHPRTSVRPDDAGTLEPQEPQEQEGA